MKKALSVGCVDGHVMIYFMFLINVISVVRHGTYSVYYDTL